MNEFTNYGIAGVAVGAIVLIVRYFLLHIDKKDTKFTNVIENHIEHSTRVQEKLCGAVDNLCDKLKK